MEMTMENRSVCKQFFVQATTLTITILLVLSGCGGQREVQTAEVSTSTQTPSPTQTQPIPDTATPTVTATPVPTYDVTEEKVQFITADETELAGTLLTSEVGDTAIIFAHMFNLGDSQKDWLRFAQTAAERGMSVFTFDFRGFGRSADGASTDIDTEMDLQAAVDFLESRGFTRLICVGASAGGSACLKVSLNNEFAGLAVLASRISIEEADFGVLTMPKLFVVTEEDNPDVVSDMQKMYDLSSEPKSLTVFSGDAHGTDLFLTYYVTELTELLLNFLQGLYFI
jgi:alpha/beta superfamily hydrolase